MGSHWSNWEEIEGFVCLFTGEWYNQIEVLRDYFAFIFLVDQEV